MSDEEPRELGEEEFCEEELKPESESEEELDEESELEVESGEEDYEPGGEEVNCPFEILGEKTPLSSSIKQFKENSIDRLSALPDCLLIHILSFLQTRKAASTCVLSKRWRFLWTESSSLEFIDRNQSVKNTSIFLSMVQSVLSTRAGNNLERLKISCYYDIRLASDFNVIVEFIVKLMVKEVDLVLFRKYIGDYTLPEIVYSNSSLTWLNLSGCIFISQKPIMWQSLTTLSLHSTYIDNHVIGKILSGCPVLDSLHLADYRGSYLEIDSQSVRTLTLYNWEVMDYPLLEISAPYIKFLQVSGSKIRLRNIRSVQTAKLNFEGFIPDRNFVQLKRYLTDLFASLQHVKTLDLGRTYIQDMSKLAETGWQFPKSRQECLIVEAGRNKESISSIVHLVESSTKLERLVIRNETSGWVPYNRDLPARIDLNCDLLHLKTVDIIGFASKRFAGEPMLSLARILLKRAIVLQKMVIKDDEFSLRKASNFPKISQTLLGLPRSSQKAMVLFE